MKNKHKEPTQTNKMKYKIICCSGCALFIHVPSLWMCVLFCFIFICLHVCVCVFKSKVHCGSFFEPSASGLPCYCTSNCVHSWYNWRANCVKGEKKMDHIQETEYQSQNTTTNCCPGSVVFIHVACLWMCVLFYFSCDCLHVYAYVFKYKVWLRAGHFRAALLLHTTRVRSWCNWRSNCVVV